MCECVGLCVCMYVCMCVSHKLHVFIIVECVRACMRYTVYNIIELYFVML